MPMDEMEECLKCILMVGSVWSVLPHAPVLAVFVRFCSAHRMVLLLLKTNLIVNGRTSAVLSAARQADSTRKSN